MPLIFSNYLQKHQQPYILFNQLRISRKICYSTLANTMP